MARNPIAPVSVGDVVQITDEAHRWFPALIVVTEIKSFGVQGYMTVVATNDRDTPNPSAFIRLNRDQYEYVGPAIFVRQDTAA